MCNRISVIEAARPIFVASCARISVTCATTFPLLHQPNYYVALCRRLMPALYSRRVPCSVPDLDCGWSRSHCFFDGLEQNRVVLRPTCTFCLFKVSVVRVAMI